MGTTVFRKSIKDIVDIQLVEDNIDRLSWRDFGNGLWMARLAKDGKRELVLYRIAADAAPDAFVKHEHAAGSIKAISSTWTHIRFTRRGLSAIL
jgi:hypothetical protein